MGVHSKSKSSGEIIKSPSLNVFKDVGQNIFKEQDRFKWKRRELHCIVMLKKECQTGSALPSNSKPQEFLFLLIYNVAVEAFVLACYTFLWYSFAYKVQNEGKHYYTTLRIYTLFAQV